jgi:hypothetical protein
MTVVEQHLYDSNPLNAPLGWQIRVKMEHSRCYGGVTFPGGTVKSVK